MLHRALLAVVLLASPALVLAQQPAEQHECGGARPRGRSHRTRRRRSPQETIWGPISRVFNSAVLFGVLYYFLRRPFAAYLSSRDGEIRNDLLTAAEMKKTATAQLAELQQKMAALPAELELLKAHGQEEIAAEEARIERAAAAERERLIEQTRREIDLQLRIAQRELVEHASNLAVGLATDRIREEHYARRPGPARRSLPAAGEAMTPRAAAARYARALLDVVINEQGNPEQVEQQLASIVDVIAAHPELQRALTNPAVPVTGKRGVMQELTSRANAAMPVAKL